MSGKPIKSFQFHVPVELVKSKNKDDEPEWIIKGIASTGDQDLQQEKVDQQGLDISMLKAGRGLFNWDHQKGPENVLGQIEDADFVEHNGKKALMVKGYLFKYQERAKAFYDILRSVKKSNGPRVHMSIEGKILERDTWNPKDIRKARVDKVALTLDPVNPHTYAELVKSLSQLNSDEVSDEEVNVPRGTSDKDDMIEISKSELLESIENIVSKALAAGAGYAGAPESMTSGEATTKESLDSKEKVMTHSKKKKLKKAQIMSIIEKAQEAFPDEDPMELAKAVLNRIFDNEDDSYSTDEDSESK